MPFSMQKYQIQWILLIKKLQDKKSVCHEFCTGKQFIHSYQAYVPFLNQLQAKTSKDHAAPTVFKNLWLHQFLIFTAH